MAACRGVAASVFYPDNEAGTAAALAVCRQCPVTDMCLALALRNGERHGVWGGTTERERARLRRRLTRAA
ncbi:MAG: WhiB family transcriptional regulator [Actinomycetota bacterium]